MTALLVAIAAAYGTFLVYTAVCLGWRGLGAGPRLGRAKRARARTWLAQAGLGGVAGSRLAGLSAAFALGGFVAGYGVFGAIVPAAALACAAAFTPVTSWRVRRQARMAAAQEAWPRLIEEIRVLTSALGRSVPQALVEAGRKAPAELRDAFERAEREWRLSTDFGRTVATLKADLADPTADAALETLLVAHDVGGSSLDRRLEALAEDRIRDVHDRKDARAKQAGVRFARRFVVVVPLGMALVGMGIGSGRAAYATATGQAAVLLALAITFGCWLWAGRLMELPTERRVFDA
jgi:tight adherence protein B